MNLVAGIGHALDAVINARFEVSRPHHRINKCAASRQAGIQVLVKHRF